MNKTEILNYIGTKTDDIGGDDKFSTIIEMKSNFDEFYYLLRLAYDMKKCSLNFSEEVNKIFDNRLLESMANLLVDLALSMENVNKEVLLKEIDKVIDNKKF